MSWFLLLVVFWKPLWSLGNAAWYQYQGDTVARNDALAAVWSWLGQLWALIKPF
jgi:hypothetical protein